MGRLRTDGGSLLSFAKIHPPSAMANRGEKDHGSYENYEWTGVEKLNLQLLTPFSANPDGASTVKPT